MESNVLYLVILKCIYYYYYYLFGQSNKLFINVESRVKKLGGQYKENNISKNREKKNYQ